MGKVIVKEYDEENETFHYNQLEINEEELIVEEHDVMLQVFACNVDETNTKLLCELLTSKLNMMSVSCGVAGLVKHVGASVKSLQVGDRVAGIVPLDSDKSGCAEFCTLHDFNVVRIPENVEFTDAAHIITEGVKAFIALQYHAHVESGKSVLIMNAAAGFGYLAVQLALSWGAKVFAVVENSKEKSFFKNLQAAPHHVFEVDGNMSTLSSMVLEETGHLGVDIIIDNGVRLFANKNENKSADNKVTRPSKQHLISCMATGGHWITTCSMLQLDPPDSVQLFLRCASVSFLFEHAWTLSSAYQGKWLHMAKHLINKLAQGSLCTNVMNMISFSEAADTLNNSNTRVESNCTVIRMVADSVR